MSSDYHDPPPRGRRCKIIRVDLFDLAGFLRNGLAQLRGAVPSDASLKLAWVDHERGQLCLLVHSNSYGLVHVGEILPDVGPFELTVLLDRPIVVGGLEVLPSDRLFVEGLGENPLDDAGMDGAVGWTCGRCERTRPPQELAVVVAMPVVGRYCGACAG